MFGCQKPVLSSPLPPHVLVHDSNLPVPFTIKTCYDFKLTVLAEQTLKPVLLIGIELLHKKLVITLL